jgi:hypothetical protein
LRYLRYRIAQVAQRKHRCVSCGGTFEAVESEKTVGDSHNASPGADDDFESPRSVVFSRGNLRSLVLWHIVTFGFYDLVWFYRQWRAHERTHGTRISAFWRSWFALYFVHILFRSIDARARAVGVDPQWEPNAQAWRFVALVLAAIIASFVDDDASDVVGLVCAGLSVFPLLAAQRVSNRAIAVQYAAAAQQDEDEDEDDR